MVTVTVRRFGVSVTEKRTHLSLTTYQRLDLERRMPSYVRTRTQAHTHARWLLQRTRPDSSTIACCQQLQPRRQWRPCTSTSLYLSTSISSFLLLRRFYFPSVGCFDWSEGRYELTIRLVLCPDSCFRCQRSDASAAELLLLHNTQSGCIGRKLQRRWQQKDTPPAVQR